jgi:hypothetical protein
MEQRCICTNRVRLEMLNMRCKLLIKFVADSPGINRVKEGTTRVQKYDA